MAAAFSLLEISLVIGIIGLVVGMGVSATSTMVDSARITATKEKIRAVEDALVAFWVTNGRLPCPAALTTAEGASGYGEEQRSSNNCTVTTTATSGERIIDWGMVPFRTLGLSDGYAYDNWNGRIVYNVNRFLTRDNGAKAFISDTKFHFVPALADFTIASPISKTDPRHNAAFTLASHGENQFAAYKRSGTRTIGTPDAPEEIMNARLTSTTPYADEFHSGYVLLNEYHHNGNDDITHFVPFWKLASISPHQDIRENRPSLFFTSSASPYLYSYSWDGSGFVKQSNYSSLPGSAMLGKIATFPDTIDMLAFPKFSDGSAGGGQRCYDHLGAVVNTFMRCRARNTSGTAVEDVNHSAYFSFNPYIPYNSTGLEGMSASAIDATPYVLLNYVGESVSTNGTALPVTPAGPANAVEFSSISGHLAVAHEDTSSPFDDFLSLYKFDAANNVTATEITSPVILPTGVTTDVAYSADGNYLAVSHATAPYVTIYEITGETYSKISDPEFLPTGNANAVSFSHDSQFMAVAHETSPFMTVYKIDALTDTFTKLNDLDSDDMPSGTVNDVDFAANGHMFAVAVAATSGNPPLMLYDILHGELLTKAADADTMPADGTTGHSVEFADNSSVSSNPSMISSGLTGWWRVNEGSGTQLNDETESENDGTFVDSPTWSSDVSGSMMTTGSIELDGANDYVDLGSEGGDLLESLPMSVSFWVYFDTTTGLDGIMSKAQSSPFNFGLRIDPTNNYFSVYNDNNAFNSTQNVQSGQWYHLVITLATGERKMYINGELELTNTSAYTMSVGGDSLYFGLDYLSSVNRILDGKLDDIRFYNRVLTAEEVERIHNGDG